MRAHGVDAISSTNAIHLYYDLEDTLRSWTRVLKPGASCFVQSGNIGNPAAAPDDLNALWEEEWTQRLLEAATARVKRQARARTWCSGGRG